MVEDYTRATGIRRTAKDILTDPDGETGTAIWHRAARALGQALATATALLDPATIVVGGGLAEAGNPYLDLVRTALHDNTPFEMPLVSGAALGERAAVAGAGILARQLISND